MNNCEAKTLGIAAWELTEIVQSITSDLDERPDELLLLQSVEYLVLQESQEPDKRYYHAITEHMPNLKIILYSVMSYEDWEDIKELQTYVGRRRVPMRIVHGSIYTARNCFDHTLIE
jgi:hypothetical protein